MWIIRNVQILWKRLLLSCRIESAKMIFYWKVTARCKMFTFLCFVKHITTLVFMLKIFRRIHQGIVMCLFFMPKVNAYFHGYLIIFVTILFWKKVLNGNVLCPRNDLRPHCKRKREKNCNSWTSNNRYLAHIAIQRVY